MTSMPRFTVVYNIVSPESDTWIGTGREFFDFQMEATACYKRHEKAGNVPTMRPFHREMDHRHLGECHQPQGKGEA